MEPEEKPQKVLLTGLLSVAYSACRFVFNIFKDLFLLFLMCVCTCEWVPTEARGVGSLWREAVASCLMWPPEAELRSSGRTVSAFSC